MRAFLVVVLGLLVEASPPLRIKVSQANHVYASSKDIANAVGLAESYMRSQMHAMARTSFLKKRGAWATKAKESTASLFLTQPMRSPGGLTKINVIEQRPQGGAAAAISDFARAAAEREEFVAGLSTLR